MSKNNKSTVYVLTHHWKGCLDSVRVFSSNELLQKAIGASLVDEPDLLALKDIDGDFDTDQILEEDARYEFSINACEVQQ